MAQIPVNNQFQYVQTYLDTPFVSTGLQMDEQVRVLATPTYPSWPTGVTYGVGAILALNSSNQYVNCDPSQTGQPQATAVGVLSDQYIPGIAASQPGSYCKAATGKFTVQAAALYATANNKSDVVAAMTSMGATFDATSNTWSKF